MTITYSRKSMVLAILPKFSGLLSFLGSSYIFQDVLRHIVTERQRRHHHNHHHFSHGKEKVGVYHRLILGLSVCDLVASIVIMVGTWAIPKEYVGTYMASGTIGTCTVVGIMNELGNMGAPIYNASLCIHYVLVILMGMSEEKIASKGIEWYLHIVPVTFAVVFATLGFIFKLYNGAGSWCWFAPYPPNCSLEPPQPHQTSIIPCTRGHYYHQFRLMHIGIAWVCLVVCSISMFSIYRKVYKQESKVAKYRYNNNSNGGYPSKNGSKSKHSNNNYHNHPNNNNSSQRPNDNDESHSNDNNVEANHTNYNQYITSSSSSSRRRPPKKSKSRQIADQGMFFVIVFILTWTFPTITRIFQWLGWSIPLTLNMLFVVFFPLQGFFNALVYLRPKYLKFKKKKEKLAIKKAAAKWKQQQQIKQKITQLFYNNNNSDDNEGDNHNNNNNDDIWDNNNSNSNSHHLDAVSHTNSYHTNNKEDENNVPTATTTNNHHHHCLDTNSNDNILLTSDNDDNDSHSFIIRETYQNHHSNNANAFASANADAAVGVGNTAAVDP